MPAPVITVAQMREWEQASWTAGRSELDVIRQVGRAVAAQARRLTQAGDSVLILAGKGHNGEDARACREHLSDRKVEIVNVNDPAKQLAEVHSQLKRTPALVIDALFGIGINRRLDEHWTRLVQEINTAHLPVLAVDVPSGLDADSGEALGAVVKAQVTLTVGAPKAGFLGRMAWESVGRLEVATDVGLVPCPESLASQLSWTLRSDFIGYPPRRGVNAHKGTFGSVAIVAGSAGYHGAAVLAALGAERARPGLIAAFVHEPAYGPVAAQLKATMVHAWKDLPRLPRKTTALLVGPGLASPDLPGECAREVAGWWSSLELPMVVDASALDWLTPGSIPAGAIRVMTPHPGEAARLLGTTSEIVQGDRPGVLRELSARFGGCWVVLKGHQTLVGRGAEVLHVNSSGNPNLAQGGAGDLLAGYLAGLLAQPELQRDPLRTIRFAVWQHGAAADLLERSRANWTIADLAAAVGRVRP